MQIAEKFLFSMVLHGCFLMYCYTRTSFAGARNTDVLPGKVLVSARCNIGREYLCTWLSLLIEGIGAALPGRKYFVAFHLNRLQFHLFTKIQ